MSTLVTILRPMRGRRLKGALVWLGHRGLRSLAHRLIVRLDLVHE